MKAFIHQNFRSVLALLATGVIASIATSHASEIFFEDFANSDVWLDSPESDGWTLHSSQPAVDKPKHLYNPDGPGTKGRLIMTRPIEVAPGVKSISIRFTLTLAGKEDVPVRVGGVGVLATESNAFGLLISGAVERSGGASKAILRLGAPSQPFGEGKEDILFESEPVDSNAGATFELEGTFIPSTGEWTFFIDGQSVGKFDASDQLKSMGISLDRPELVVVRLDTRLNPRIARLSIEQTP
jgi:hypothetical protein